MANAVSKDLIFLDVKAESKDDALRKIADFAFEQGRVESAELYYEALVAREGESSTGFTEGVAIPHGKSSTVKDASVLLVRFSEGIDWDSMDGKPTTLALALTIPEEGAAGHLQILSKIARSLMNEEFLNSLTKSTDKDELLATLENAINK